MLGLLKQFLRLIKDCALHSYFDYVPSKLLRQPGPHSRTNAKWICWYKARSHLICQNRTYTNKNVCIVSANGSN